jgi:hypothetical protein
MLASPSGGAPRSLARTGLSQIFPVIREFTGNLQFFGPLQPIPKAENTAFRGRIRHRKTGRGWIVQSTTGPPEGPRLRRASNTAIRLRKLVAIAGEVGLGIDSFEE